jgi:hypothetical protein
MLALMNLLINGAESLIAEYGCRRIGYNLSKPEEIMQDELEVTYINCEEMPKDGFEIDYAVNVGLLKKYTFVNSAEGINYTQIYDWALRVFERDIMGYLKSYSFKTAMKSIEYMIIVLTNGNAVLLKGEVNKVVIPSVKASVTAHTHPHGCLPSPQDIRSLTHILLEGGLGGGISSPQCNFVIFRRGPFTEKDYESMIRFRDILATNPESIKSYIMNGFIGTNLIIRTFT